MNRWSSWLACVFAFLLFFIPGTALARGGFVVPTHQGAVTDTSGTLNSEDDNVLESKIADYRSRTGNEIGVLVIESLEGNTIEDIAYRTFNEWGVGQKGLDNGVLLVVAMKEHRSRIETGKGIGHLLPDVTAARILSDELAPWFRRKQYREGILATLMAIENALGGRPAVSGVTPKITTTGGSPAPDAPSPTSPVTAPPPNGSGLFGIFLVGGVFLLLGFVVHGLTRRSRRLGSYDSTWSSSSSSFWDSSSSSSSSSSFDAGSSFSSGGGGGGSDFGGGSSGGGGASGDWR